ncbi:hypothetical protein GH722_20620, partial [Alphaproteobacteria bacterium HT1-32]|nr:hypothetical protein [Alphaproteobacteria bacterium HT1-32]
NISVGEHCEQPFQYLVFTAEPYADPSDNPTGDSSDYFIRSVDFETDYSFGMEEFTYQMADGDGDVSEATLTINMTDLDRPDSPTPEDPENSGQPDLNLVNTTVDEDDLSDGTDETKESTTVSQDILVDFGADGSGRLELTVNDALTDMGLTSNGVALDYTVSEDGTVITATAGEGGDTVFTVTLNGDADSGYSYSFDLQGAVDHPDADGENQLDLTFGMQVFDKDGDCAEGTFTVGIIDDVPVAEVVEVSGPGVTVSLDEDDLSDGTDETKESLSATGDLGLGGDLITIDYGADGPADGQPTALGYDDLDWALEGPAGLSSQGEAVTYSWDAATQTLQATADGRDVFTVELNEDGSYTFTLQDSLDHGAADGENSLGLEFTLTGTSTVDSAVDFDGDSVSLGDQSLTQTFSVNVVDDTPAAAEVGTPTAADTVTLDEDDLADGTDADKESLSASGDLGLDGDLITINYGADGPADGAPTALGYDDLSFELTGPSGLTSQGEDVTYEWDASTNTLQATADGRDVFTVELNEDGSYTFTLQDSLDHGAADGENSMGLEFTLTGSPADDAVTDYDLDPSQLSGLTVEQTFSVNVTDDVPEAVVNDPDPVGSGSGSEYLTVTNMGEESASYNNTYGYYIQNEDGEPTTGQIIWSNTKQDIGETYTIDGVDPDSVGFFVIPNGSSLNGNLENGMEVTFEQDGNGNWHVVDDNGGVLNGQGTGAIFSNADLNADGLDHTSDSPSPGDQNWEDIHNGGDVDYNDVNIEVERYNTTVSVDEDDLADGTDQTKEGLSASGDLGMDGDLITINYGADGPADGAPTALGYDDLSFELTGPEGLTSQGEPVTYEWDAATNTLQASSDGRDVFTVELNEDGSFTFTLQDSLDHGAADGENSMDLGFTLTGTPDADALTDYDLDPALVGDVTVTQTFSVNVVDDVPETGEVGTVGQAESVSLDEDDLADGTDADKESLSASGDLGLDGDLITINYGADGPADGAPTALGYDDLSFELTGPSGLTSQGEDVTYEWDASTNTLQATADGRDVFTVELNEDGSYTFTLQDSLDHGAADGENSMGLEFTLTGSPADDAVTDYDLDPSQLSGLTVEQTFSVNVTDDVPEVVVNDPDPVGSGSGSEYLTVTNMG